MNQPSQPNSNLYRPELPPVPARIRVLPIRRGYPVPWFVAKVDGDYHFPTADAGKIAQALRKRLCWVCGQPMGRNLAFVIGPMCCVNRISSEPPSHLECAIFSAQACPFLARPHMKRAQDHPEGAEPPPGIYLDRNPGCTAVWVTKDFLVRRAGKGVLFRIGDPVKVEWFARGRPATHDEIMASIESGLPLLTDMARAEGPAAIEALDRSYTDALRLVPA